MARPRIAFGAAAGTARAGQGPRGSAVGPAQPDALRHPGRAANAKTVNQWLLRPLVKPLCFVLLLLPLVWLVWGAVAGTLGANPAETLIRSTGDWTLRMICLTLLVTPLRTITGWHALARLRRMVGLFTFFYGVLHFLCFAWLDQGFDIAAILRDIARRPFILVGSLALLLMLPLAATSFNRAIKAMGSARWQALHRLVYASALLGVLHFFWMRSGKNDYAEVAVYGLIIAILLGWRLQRWQRGRRRAAGPA